MLDDPEIRCGHIAADAGPTRCVVTSGPTRADGGDRLSKAGCSRWTTSSWTAPPESLVLYVAAAQGRSYSRAKGRPVLKSNRRRAAVPGGTGPLDPVRLHAEDRFAEPGGDPRKSWREAAPPAEFRLPKSCAHAARIRSAVTRVCRRLEGRRDMQLRAHRGVQERVGDRASRRGCRHAATWPRISPTGDRRSARARSSWAMRSSAAFPVACESDHVVAGGQAMRGPGWVGSWRTPARLFHPARQIRQSASRAMTGVGPRARRRPRARARPHQRLEEHERGVLAGDVARY